MSWFRHCLKLGRPDFKHSLYCIVKNGRICVTSSTFVWRHQHFFFSSSPRSRGDNSPSTLNTSKRRPSDQDSTSTDCTDVISNHHIGSDNGTAFDVQPPTKRSNTAATENSEIANGVQVSWKFLTEWHYLFFVLCPNSVSRFRHQTAYCKLLPPTKTVFVK